MSSPLICNSCGKVYLHGSGGCLCIEPSCRGAVLDPLFGFISYRRNCQTHRGVEANDLASRIKDRVEKVLSARRLHGGFFIDKTGIEREDFEKKISTTIQVCKGRVLLLILTPGALDPKVDTEEDWMRKEIALAIDSGMEIIPIKASKYRQDKDFEWPQILPVDIALIKKKNLNLSFIGDLDDRYLVDSVHHIANEIVQYLQNNQIIESSTSTLAKNLHVGQGSNPLISLDQWKRIVSKKMVPIPGGSFEMGSKKGSTAEQPLHQVQISSFYMMKCEVTQKDYEKIVGTNPSNFTGDLNRPVESVSWFDAVHFCNKWSLTDGLEPVYEISDGEVLMDVRKNGYRLPTEAEWEYAARAGSAAEYFWGDDEKLAPQYAWDETNSDDTTHSVGTKLKNAYGLYDMSGNVWEWTADWYGIDYYQHSEKNNPLGPEFGEFKAIRGGCYFQGVSRLRCASRIKRLPKLVDDVTGFRCVARYSV